MHACDEVAGAAIAAQVFFYDIVVGSDEGLVRALSAFHLRFAAEALRPIVGAGRRIS